MAAVPAGGRVVDAIVVHEGAIGAGTLQRYQEEGAVPLALREDVFDGRRVLHHDLLAPGPKLRHEPDSTAQALVAAWRACSASKQGS